jgi:hypothetical protein
MELLSCSMVKSWRGGGGNFFSLGEGGRRRFPYTPSLALIPACYMHICRNRMMQYSRIQATVQYGKM